VKDFFLEKKTKFEFTRVFENNRKKKMKGRKNERMMFLSCTR